MENKNYYGEEYFDTSSNLLTNLNEICDLLIKNLKTTGKSYLVEEIVNAKSFNKLWQMTPNNPDDKYSPKEYKGIYAFATVIDSKIDCKYIGISRTIRRRFSAHVKGKKKNKASWAYLMIKHYSQKLKSINKREEKIPEYQKRIIYPLKFTFYPIVDNMLLQMAEVYCVNKLKSYWNSFKTH